MHTATLCNFFVFTYNNSFLIILIVHCLVIEWVGSVTATLHGICYHIGFTLRYCRGRQITQNANFYITLHNIMLNCVKFYCPKKHFWSFTAKKQKKKNKKTKHCCRIHLNQMKKLETTAKKRWYVVSFTFSRHFCPKQLTVTHTFTHWTTSTLGAVLGFIILYKDTWTSRPRELNQQPSDNKTLALPLSHSRTTMVIMRRNSISEFEYLQKIIQY